jgi:hypothetical protein
MDRVEVAAEVFVQAFTLALGDSYPRAKELARTLAAIGSVPLGKWTFDTDRRSDSPTRDRAGADVGARRPRRPRHLR